LTRLSGEPEFYRHCLITAIGTNDKDQDLGQLFELGAFYAARGGSEMKRAMYASFERAGFAEAGLACAEQLVVLGGLNGRRYAMKSFGTLEADERPWRFGRLIDTLKRHHGDQALPADLDPFVKEWEEDEKRCELARQQPRPRPSYEALKQCMTRAGAMGWARKGQRRRACGGGAGS
jgi:hypothetical protein